MPIVQYTAKLTFLSEDLSRQWALVDARIRSMVWEVVYLASRFGYGVFVTSLIRPDGIHSTKGAADVDFVPHEEDVGVGYHAFGRMASRYVNRTYKYGTGWFGNPKPAALWHGGEDETTHAGWHLHLQAPAGRDMKLKAG